jgi:F-type H+-transporting ATPase subunit epsilon
MGFALSIVTPQGQAYAGEVDGIVLPGVEGDFGVLPEHERFLTPLRVGAVEIMTGSSAVLAAVSGGFADVQGDQVTVLADSCELSDEIDVARADEARAVAEKALAGAEDAERAAEYREALDRARNRLEVGGRS